MKVNPKTVRYNLVISALFSFVAVSLAWLFLRFPALDFILYWLAIFIVMGLLLVSYYVIILKTR